MTNNYINKKVGILGLGISGKSIYKFLHKDNQVICWDDKPSYRESFQKEFPNFVEKDLNDQHWQDLDFIVISPGIPPTHEIHQLARSHNIKITSDIEIFLDIQKNKQIVAVTGTNGKSTTVSLLYHVLKENGYNYQLGGNIGKGVLDLPLDSDGYILEISSFQLDLLPSPNFSVAVLLNISPDHLDRYITYENYIASKFRIFNSAEQKIIGIDNAITKKYYLEQKRSDYIAVSSKKENEQLADISLCNSVLNNKVLQEEYVINNLPNLVGPHNQLNISVVFAAAQYLGLPAENIINSLKSFAPLAHRMEYLGTKDNIKYYNDSKATNIDAACYALNSTKNIHWLVGGVFKEKTLDQLDDNLTNVTKAYLFGQDKDVFAKYLDGKIAYKTFDNMSEAFLEAQKDARNNASINSTILLSPACASVDQFKNFEDRGNKFKELYEEI